MAVFVESLIFYRDSVKFSITFQAPFTLAISISKYMSADNFTINMFYFAKFTFEPWGNAQIAGQSHYLYIEIEIKISSVKEASVKMLTQAKLLCGLTVGLERSLSIQKVAGLNLGQFASR